MIYNGSVILVLKGGAGGLWNNIRRQISVMSPSSILVFSLLQLVFNNLPLVCGFLFFSYEVSHEPL